MKTFLKDLYVFLCILGLSYSFKYMYTESLWWGIGVVIFLILITFQFYNKGYNDGEIYGMDLGWVKRDIEIKIKEEAKKQQNEIEVYINNELINKYIEAFKAGCYFGTVGNSYVISSILNQGEESIVTFTKIKYFEDDK